MDQVSREIEALGERVERILAAVHRLTEENAGLREQLAAIRDRHQRLERRVAEARERVQAALVQLPATEETAAQRTMGPSPAGDGSSGEEAFVPDCGNSAVSRTGGAQAGHAASAVNDIDRD